jgi:hypothetical protein
MNNQCGFLWCLVWTLDTRKIMYRQCVLSRCGVSIADRHTHFCLICQPVLSRFRFLSFAASTLSCYLIRVIRVISMQQPHAKLPNNPHNPHNPPNPPNPPNPNVQRTPDLILRTSKGGFVYQGYHNPYAMSHISMHVSISAHTRTGQGQAS